MNVSINDISPFQLSDDLVDKINRNSKRGDEFKLNNEYTALSSILGLVGESNLRENALKGKSFEERDHKKIFQELKQVLYNDKLNEMSENALTTRDLHKQQAKLKEVERRTAVESRLSTKLTLNHLKQYSEEMEANLKYGIENINKKLNQQKSQKTSISIESAEEKANAMMKQLIEEENQAKKNKRNNYSNNIKGKRINKKVKQKAKKAEICQTSDVKDETSVIQIEPVLSQEVKLSQFVLNLNSFKCLEHPRIHRWKTTDIESIRLFMDKDSQGKEIFRYKDLSDEQICEQRARHFLPGTERLLKDHFYRSIYAFRTNRGSGVVGQLGYNQEKHNGILYFGANKTGYIFHKYFEYIDFKQTKKDLFQDVEFVDHQEKTETDGEWTSAQGFQLEVSKEGVLNFTYPDHDIKIYPLHPELFEKKISQIKGFV